VFVEVHAIMLAIRRKPKESLGIEGIEDREGYRQGGEGDGAAPDGLRDQDLEATPVEETRELGGQIGRDGIAAGGRELSAGEEAQREGALDAVDHVHRNGADGIVDAQVLE